MVRIILSPLCLSPPAYVAFNIPEQMPINHLFQNVIERKPYPDDENLLEVKFATTPIMSTYLVAFVIGEYDFVESQSSDGVTVRVYTPVGKAEQGKFALEVRTSLI